MSFNNNNYELVVNGVTFPMAKYEGYKVTKRKLNAYAERTPKTMRIDQLGDVWEITYTAPPMLDNGIYTQMANALSPFIVSVTFWNPFTNSRMTQTCYHTDLEVSVLGNGLNSELTITFIGTEVN